MKKLHTIPKSLNIKIKLKDFDNKIWWGKCYSFETSRFTRRLELNRYITASGQFFAVANKYGTDERLLYSICQLVILKRSLLIRWLQERKKWNLKCEQLNSNSGFGIRIVASLALLWIRVKFPTRQIMHTNYYISRNCNYKFFYFMTGT